jgi:hypothetical protein
VKVRPSDWLTFAATVIGSVVAIAGVALLLNFPADCAPGVTGCGETRRDASFVLLALGAVWLIYLIVRFVRSPTKFR